MFHNLYYITVFTTVFGGSTQFYSYDVVNPAQRTLIDWMNRTFTERGQPKSIADLNLFWSIIVASIAVGAICGAFLTKPLAEKLGRRNALIVNGILSIFGAAMEFIAKPIGAPEILILGRIILGANMGLTSGLVPMYLMEITPTKFRGTAGTCHQVAVAFSDWFSLLLALPEVLGSESTWPFAFGFPALPAFALCCILPFCPESPKFSLLSRHDRAQALDDIARLVDVQEGQRMFESLQREAVDANLSSSNGSLRFLFTNKNLRMPLIICVWVMIAQQFTGPAAIFAYSTDMFLNAGLEPQIARFSTLGIGIVYFLFACSSVFLIERKGRRALSLFQLSTVTLSLTAMSIFTWAQSSFNSKFASYATIVSLLVYMCGYGVGSPIPWMIASEIFPTKFRSSAVTIAISVAWSLVFVISLAYLPFKEIVGVSLSYLPFILVSALSTGFVYFLLPETKNRQTHEIAEDIQIRSDTLRRYSLNILPTVSSAIRISPSAAVANGEIQQQRVHLLPRPSSLASVSSAAHTPSAPQSHGAGKYCSLGFTPDADRRQSVLMRLIMERQRNWN